MSQTLITPIDQAEETQQLFFGFLMAGIVDSTLWRMEDYPTRLLFVTMLAIKDKNGCVFNTIPGLAGRANIQLTECEAGLKRLLSPDAYSRTKILEGRRLAEIEGGWRMVNANHYKQLIQAQMRRKKQADWQKDYRKRHVTEKVALTQTLTSVDTPLAAVCSSNALVDGALVNTYSETDSKAFKRLSPEDPLKRSGQERLERQTAQMNSLENEMMEQARNLIGREAMERDGGYIRTLIRQDANKADRVFADMKSHLTEGGRIGNPFGYFVDTWKRFK